MGRGEASSLREVAGILSSPGGCDSELSASVSWRPLFVAPPEFPQGRRPLQRGVLPRKFFSLVCQALCSLSACAEADGGGSGGRVSDIAADDMEFWRRNLRERSEPELSRGLAVSCSSYKIVNIDDAGSGGVGGLQSYLLTCYSG